VEEAPQAIVVKPPTGHLLVRSAPVAHLKLDGEDAGMTANWADDLPSGSHRLQLETADHRFYVVTVTLRPGATTSVCWDFDQAHSCN
jgi:hypothetical protein